MFKNYESEYKCNSDENYISYEPCIESTGLITIKDSHEKLIIKYNNQDIKKSIKKPSTELKNAVSKLTIENYIKVLGYINSEDVSISCVYLPYRKKILVIFYIKKKDTCMYKSLKYNNE